MDHDVSLKALQFSIFRQFQTIKVALTFIMFLAFKSLVVIDEYNQYVPNALSAIMITSAIGLLVSKFIDKNFRITPYVSTTVDVGIMICLIVASQRLLPDLFFWLTGLVMVAYFFTNKWFAGLLLASCYVFQLTWDGFIPFTDYYEMNAFRISFMGFGSFLFLIFYYSMKTRDQFYYKLLKLNKELKKVASFPYMNPNPIFEFSFPDQCTPKNKFAKEILAVASKEEIYNLKNYLKDSLEKKESSKFYAKLGGHHFSISTAMVDQKLNVYFGSIDELISTQNKLLEKDAYNRAVIDAIPGFVSWVDDDLTYLGVNQHLCDFFNKVPSDFIGKELGHVNDTGRDLGQSLFESNKDIIQAETSFDYNYETHYNYMTMKKYNGGRNAVLISIDITKLKHAEMQVRKEQARAEGNAKLAAYGEMAAGIAHEINNPLSIITGVSYRLGTLVKKERLTIESVLDLLPRIENGVDRITKIIRGMKNLARDGEGDPMESATVREIVDDALTLHYKKCQNLDIKLTVDFLDPYLSLKCQRVQISQIFVILLNNAIDAIDSYEEKWINITATDAGENVVFGVQDSGPGIPEDIQEKIFKPFFTTKKLGKGTGLGLSLVTKIVDSHQGGFSLDSKAANTKFLISLPKEQATKQVLDV